MASGKLSEMWLTPKTGVPLARPVVALPHTDALPGLITSLAQRRGYDLTDDEQRVLRASLCLAGAWLPVAGLCDLDFFVAFENFQMKFGDSNTGLSTLTIGRVLEAAADAVGGKGRFAAMRAAWFDAIEAPRYLREVSSVALLVRALRERTLAG
jgi:hypothetical protein